MSATCPYVVDDDDDVYDSDDSDLELLDFDSDVSDPEIVSVRECTHTRASSSSSPTSKKLSEPLKNASIKYPDIIIREYKLSKGSFIRAGDTAELQDRSSHEADGMHSGDFLHVRHIIKNLETDEIRLRGHIMWRTKYLGQIHDWKLNELSMVLRVDENDDRCPFVAGIEDVPISHIIGMRECALTNKPYPMMTFRDDGHCAYPVGMSKLEMKRQIFHGGRLTCRVVSIFFIRKTSGKAYSGIVRRLYARESSASMGSSSRPILEPGLSRNTSITIDDEYVIITNGDPFNEGKRRARPVSVEILEAEPAKRKSPHATKKGKYTFGDVFCGIGGASQGATQAGLFIRWGLDNDKRALQGYQMNHPTAYSLQQNAHDFAPAGVRKDEFRVDVLHLSPPCCYWSPAHTIDGPNDQANYEAIYTVGPILTKVRPRVATLEQTFGLMTHSEHKRNFHMLLYDIGKAGYDVRYQIQDLSRYGLVQKRKRLLIIAARCGTPLPSFPKPTHGPTGSGLKPFVYVDQALTILERRGSRYIHDMYHQPKLFAQRKAPYSPHGFLNGCITTRGSESYHYSGGRRWTPRELSIFQSFPHHYKFCGTQTDAIKQIGNAFPPVMAEAMYRSIVQTLEAFDNGLIDAEDDLSDFDTILEQKGVRAPQLSRSFFGTPTKATTPQYQQPSTQATYYNQSPFARSRNGFEQATSHTKDQRASSNASLLGGPLDNSRRLHVAHHLTRLVRDPIEINDDVIVDLSE